MSSATTNWLETAPSGAGAVWHPLGEWLVSHAVAIEKALVRQPRPPEVVHIDLSRLEALDTAGAMLLWQLYDRLEAQGVQVDFGNIPDSFTSLFSAVGVVRDKPMPRPDRVNPFYARIVMLGKATIGFLEDSLCFLSFLGMITLTLWRSTIQPWRLRFTSTIHHIE